jgi:hypothetical protein
MLITLWTNFASYGDPTPSNNSSPFIKKWFKIEEDVFKPQRNKKLHFLNISGSYKVDNSIKLQMEYGFYKNRFKFWENLPLVENINDLNQKHIEL